jgi:hypothetical protein
VLKTPVDTGRARGNWQAALGSPATSILESADKSGQQTISREGPTILDAPPFSVVWLSNNLPYIEPLENGHSAQAPNGMVSTTVTEIESQFRRIE